MTRRNIIIYILFLLITFWWLYLTLTMSNEYLNYVGHNLFLTRFPPLFNLMLLIAALYYMIKKDRTGTLLLAIAIILHTCFEIALGERHLLMIGYLYCIFITIQEFRKPESSPKSPTESYISNKPSDSGVIEKELIDGRKMEIHSSLGFGYAIGDTILIDGVAPPDGIYDFDTISSITVKNGKVSPP